MNRIWQRHWPPGLDEARIRLPGEPITAFLQAHAARTPRKAAIVFYGRAITFAELDDASDRFAGWLRARGIGPGDRVALYLENCPQFAIAHFGALKAGAITVPLNPMHKAIELQHELEDSGARVLVAAHAGREIVDSVRAQTPVEAVALVSYRDYVPAPPDLPLPPSLLEEPGGPVGGRASGVELFSAIVAAPARLRSPEPRAPHDTALIQYTSGTTGAPKGAELTHGNVTANCELMRAFFGFTPADVMLSVVPWFHITGMEVQLNMMAYTGATLVALHRFDVETALRAIQQHRCTITTLIATVNVAIVNHPKTPEYDLGSLRLCTSGGAPVPPEIARRWEAITGHQLIEGYGLTETTAPSHSNPPHRPRYGTVGVPLPFTGVRIVSLDDGADRAAPGRVGRDHHPRSHGHQGLLAAARRDRGGDPGRLAPHRRHRPRGRGGLLHDRGAQEGHDQGLGLQRVPRRGGGDHVPAPRGGGGRRGGRARRVPRGGRGGLRGAAPGGRRHRARDRRVVPRPDGGLQGAARGALRGCAAEDRLRQAPQARAARAGARGRA